MLKRLKANFYALKAYYYYIKSTWYHKMAQADFQKVEKDTNWNKNMKLFRTALDEMDIAMKASIKAQEAIARYEELRRD